MNYVRIILLSFFLVLAFSLQAQENPALFSSDTSKFIPELTDFFNTVGEADSKEARMVLSTFTYHWTSNLLSNAVKKQTHSICVGMSELKLQAAPYYVTYLNIISTLIKRTAEPETFSLFHKSVNYCLKSKNASRVLLQYLDQTQLLLLEAAFMKTAADAWYVRNAQYKFAFDSVPYFQFNKVSLACVVRNDSACIYDTKGSFYPITQRWIGNKGKVYWERAGFAKDVVFANLSNYQIDTRFTYYSADSVMFYHGGYFKKFLPGRLEDKAVVDITADRATYPRFYIHKGNRVYINLFKDIEFFGGFNMEGSRVIGTPADDGFSIVEVKHKQKPLITFRSTEFVIRPDRLVSARASAVIYLENDSVYHPGLRLRYNLADNEMVLNRDDEGLGQSPFFNTYHRLDMSSEAIYWKLDEDKMSFEALRGIRTKSEALFESSDYFSQYRYDKLQGIDEVNPADLVSAYVRKKNTDRFYVEDFAEWAKKPVEQIKVQLIRIANSGFITYDIDHGQAVVLPRLKEYLAAKKGVKDSDIIQFQSTIEKGANATLDLNSFRLAIVGVKEVMLSDSQYVYVVPRDGKVFVGKNRDFSFVGRVHAGLFDFIANECTFVYDKFSLNMPRIDSASMVAVAWSPDANGFRPFVKVKNVLAGMNADLFIDAPDSKSGRKMLYNYPLLISKDTSFVYFERRDIVSGVYKKKNFFFQVYPFVMDSINSLPTSDLRFDGKLVSAGIFPDILQQIKVQKDYSLGFRHVITDPGLPVYGGKGIFTDTLNLSNRGLRGSGRLKYLSSDTYSSDFLFTPDSTSAKVKNYQLAKVNGETEFPDALVKEATIKWMPSQDLMTVQNTKKEKFSMFGNKATLDGTLNVTPKGLKGKGQLAFDQAEVNSTTYNFKTDAFTSDTADFKLLTTDGKAEALRVHVFKTAIDFATRQGHFIATGQGALMEFPVIKYNCVVDEFDWLMDKNQLQLINKTSFSREKYYQMKPDELIKFNPGKEVYTSTEYKQDSLSFFAMRSIYDLTQNLLDVEDARMIKVADAAIFPFNAKLSIGQDGLIAPLKNAEIYANRTNLLHKFYNATVKIVSKHRYTAKGLYDYKPVDGDATTLEMKEIAVSSNEETYANTVITDSMNFMMNHNFRFKGKFGLNAGERLVEFEGGYDFIHDCYTLKHEWIKLRSKLDPAKIMIPVTNDPENIGNGKLRVSIYYSTTENTVRPGFFAKVENVTDPDIITAGGFVVYNAITSEYKVADSAKLLNPQLTGNMLSVNTARCLLRGEGNMQLASNLGRLKLNSAGEINYFALVDSTSVSVLSAFDFFFSEEAMKVFANDLNTADLKGVDISSVTYTRALREFVGQDEADKMLQELTLYGQYRKFPEILSHTLILSNLNMSWNKETRSFISQGDIGINNIGKESINKYVKGYVEIGKKRSGDFINMYFEPVENQWYYFAYSNGTLQALSSNKDFNDKLIGLKEDQRVIKGGKGEQSYQFIIGTGDKKAVFVRKMKQVAGEL